MDQFRYALLKDVAAMGDVQAILELADRNDDDLKPEAVKMTRKSLKKLADKGNGRAMLRLGNSYYGEDYAKARKWYEKAAEVESLDDSWALCNLGYIYYYGRDTDVDYEKAFRLYQRSAYKGNHNAMYKLGDHHYHGYFVNRDHDAAFYWYQNALKAADENEFGYPNILYRLGLCCLEGHGTSINVLASLHFLQGAEKMFYEQILFQKDPFAEETLRKAQKLLVAARSQLDAEVAISKKMSGKIRDDSQCNLKENSNRKGDFLDDDTQR